MEKYLLQRRRAQKLRHLHLGRGMVSHVLQNLLQMSVGSGGRASEESEKIEKGGFCIAKDPLSLPD